MFEVGRVLIDVIIDTPVEFPDRVEKEIACAISDQRCRRDERPGFASQMFDRVRSCKQILLQRICNIYFLDGIGGLALRP